MRISNRVLVSALLAVAAVPASAAISWMPSPLNSPPHGPGETVLDTFDAPSAFIVMSGESAIATGTTKNAAAPAGDTTAYYYTSPAIPTGTGIGTLSSIVDLYSISFYWGSVDDYNSVDVLGAGGAVIGTITGKQFSAANGNQSAPDTNQRIYITNGGDAITGLTFHATGIAFEIDDVAGRFLSDGAPSGIPEPATWALMIGGFAMVGVGARRRRQAALRVVA